MEVLFQYIIEKNVERKYISIEYILLVVLNVTYVELSKILLLYTVVSLHNLKMNKHCVKDI